MDKEELNKGPLVLVLAPTRELAQQIHVEAQRFTDAYNREHADLGRELRCACIYGGENRKQQLKQLKQQGGVHLMIATPGRLLDYLQAGIVTLKHVSFYALDEADRMLDMGFAEQVEQINTQIRPDRQTVMFSATWSSNVQKLAHGMLNEKERFMLRIGSAEMSANTKVKQEFLFVQEKDKISRLLKLLDEIVDGSRILIFA
jgi:superfamily II DNA/RNA helicase